MPEETKKYWEVILTQNVTQSMTAYVEAEDELAAQEEALSLWKELPPNWTVDEGNSWEAPYSNGAEEVTKEEYEDGLARARTETSGEMRPIYSIVRGDVYSRADARHIPRSVADALMNEVQKSLESMLGEYYGEAIDNVLDDLVDIPGDVLEKLTKHREGIAAEAQTRARTELGVPDLAIVYEALGEQFVIIVPGPTEFICGMDDDLFEEARLRIEEKEGCQP